MGINVIRYIVPLLAVPLAIWQPCDAQTENIKKAQELIDSGMLMEARQLLENSKKRNAQEELYLGRIAFLQYDFDAAQDYYGKSRKAMSKRSLDAEGEIDDFESELNIASNSIMNVEKIEVIDSIAVDRDNFFKAIHLPRSGGRLLAPSEMPSGIGRSDAMGFVGEKGNYAIWSLENNDGNYTLMHSDRLLDITWEEPTLVSENIVIGDNQMYPFMLGDGATLYFASDGPESMGGLDIFIAKRDPSTREFLQPSNLGMPYNSPFDDYMLAIDEENGIGWLATDRNLLGDKITLYVFRLNEIRNNYDPYDENILNYASLKDYKLTQQSDNINKYKDILSSLERADNKESRKEDFYLPINGRVYRTYSDFKNQAASKAMKAYMQELSVLRSKESKLADLRRDYAHGKYPEFQTEIKSLEKEVNNLRNSVEYRLSEVYRLEKKR